MSPQKLPNYLKSRRKRIGFTQKEIAYLLGGKSKSKVSTYEHFTRSPSLQTAFSLEAVFGEPASILLAGIYEETREKVKKRAEILLEKVLEQRESISRQQKLALLHHIISGP